MFERLDERYAFSRHKTYICQTSGNCYSAEQWLRQYLRERGPTPTREVFKDSRAAGWHPDSVLEAFKATGATSKDKVWRL